MDNITVCPYCNFKCVESQIYKSSGKCPSEKCNKVISKKIYDEIASLKAINGV